jgi:hypothetical protein
LVHVTACDLRERANERMSERAIRAISYQHTTSMRPHFPLAETSARPPGTDECDGRREYNQKDIHCRHLDMSTLSYTGFPYHRGLKGFLHTFLWQLQHNLPRSHNGFSIATSTHDLASLQSLARFANHSQHMRQSNALSQHFKLSIHRIHLLTSVSAPSLARPTRSPVVPSSRPVCTYIYQATECELAPLMSQISNVHPATLS